MPLLDLTLTAALRFTLGKVVADWPDISQGENSVTTTLTGVDLSDWDQAYAGVLPLAAAGTTTIDLRSFTNLAGESVVLSKVYGIIVKVTATVPASDDCELVIEPGASNGLVWSAADATVWAGQTYLMVDDVGADGTTVDATHRNIKFSNAGADALTATVVILGGT